MDPTEEQRCFDSAVDLAKRGGQLIREAFEKPKSINLKKGWSTDLVTETDTQVENLIISTLKERFPNHSFIGEESVSEGAHCELTDNPTWMIDPIDGTTNFVHRFPYVAVSIGLWVKKRPLIGVIYNAPQNLLYTARLGQGAFCNGKKLAVSGETEMSKAIVACEVGGTREPDRMAIVRENMFSLAMPPNPVHSIRSLGSAALNMCMVACGSTDAYQEFGIHCWDIAAGTLIVTEAGGIVMDPSGGELDVMDRRVLCASSPELARQIAASLKCIALERD
ncbi:inositol monophosphatase 1-like [Oscarella lobularis]|uniref:inositol monophosphatase 1-like n=1 Tax=Oscarella lobularis TaxID=121494 RepID=UPI00331311DC